MSLRQSRCFPRGRVFSPLSLLSPTSFQVRHRSQAPLAKFLRGEKPENFEGQDMYIELMRSQKQGRKLQKEDMYQRALELNYEQECRQKGRKNPLDTGITEKLYHDIDDNLTPRNKALLHVLGWNFYGNRVYPRHQQLTDIVEKMPTARSVWLPWAWGVCFAGEIGYVPNDTLLLTGFAAAVVLRASAIALVALSRASEKELAKYDPETREKHKGKLFAFLSDSKALKKDKELAEQRLSDLGKESFQDSPPAPEEDGGLMKGESGDEQFVFPKKELLTIALAGGTAGTALIAGAVTPSYAALLIPGMVLTSLKFPGIAPFLASTGAPLGLLTGGLVAAQSFHAVDTPTLIFCQAMNWIGAASLYQVYMKKGSSQIFTLAAIGSVSTCVLLLNVHLCSFPGLILSFLNMYLTVSNNNQNFELGPGKSNRIPFSHGGLQTRYLLAGFTIWVGLMFGRTLSNYNRLLDDTYDWQDELKEIHLGKKEV